MADDFGERTEAPTPRRRQEARSSGQVAKSQDLSAAVLLLAALLALKFLGGRMIESMLRGMRQSLGPDGAGDVGAALSVAGGVVIEAVRGVWPILAVVLVAAVVVMYSQVGLLFTLKPLTPDLNKLNPVEGIKRLFSPSTLVQLGQNILKLAAVMSVAWLSVRFIVNQVLLSHTVAFEDAFGLATDSVFFVGIRLAVLLLVLAFLDYAYQRYRHERQLKMTKEEVKEEMKRMEGDPVVKRRRREVQMKLAAQRLKTTVPQADVVVTNPTHYSVALRYQSDESAAPKVVAKGVDYVARRIREIALASGVPIVQKPELARKLYADVEVGAEIPERFYRAVAEVLAYVYEISGRTAAMMSGTGR